MQHTFQSIVNEILNNPQREDEIEMRDYCQRIKEGYGFKSNPSTRLVLIREDLPFVIKIDREEVHRSRWFQNYFEYRFYLHVQAYAPEFLKCLPQIYWISPCTRFMLVEKVPIEVYEGDVDYIIEKNRNFLQWIGSETHLDLYEVSKPCSWRLFNSGKAKLVDTGALNSRFSRSHNAKLEESQVIKL